MSAVGGVQLANVPPPEATPPPAEVPSDAHPAAAAAPVPDELQTATEHPAGDAHAKPGLPQLDTTTFAGQIFWLVITFAALYFVMSRIAVPKIGGVIAAREGRIKGDLDRAAQAQRNSEAAIAAYEKALAEARGRAVKVGDEIRKAVQADAEAKSAAAAKHLAADLALAEKRIAEMRSSAMARVGEVAREAAADIVAKLMGELADGRKT